MPGDLLAVTVEVPYLLLMMLVVLIGLMSWVILWSRERKLDLRDQETERNARRRTDCRDSAR